MKRRFLPRIRKRVVLVVALCLMMTSSFFLPPLQQERIDRYNNFVGNAIDHWVEDHTHRRVHVGFTHLVNFVDNPFTYIKTQADTEQKYSKIGQKTHIGLSYAEAFWEALKTLRMQIYIMLTGGTLYLLYAVIRRESRRNRERQLKIIQPRTVYTFADEKRHL